MTDADRITALETEVRALKLLLGKQQRTVTAPRPVKSPVGRSRTRCRKCRCRLTTSIVAFVQLSGSIIRNYALVAVRKKNSLANSAQLLSLSSATVGAAPSIARGLLAGG